MRVIQLMQHALRIAKMLDGRERDRGGGFSQRRIGRGFIELNQGAENNSLVVGPPGPRYSGRR
jgi:hypothetical protein